MLLLIACISFVHISTVWGAVGRDQSYLGQHTAALWAEGRGVGRGLWGKSPAQDEPGAWWASGEKARVRGPKLPFPWETRTKAGP